MISPKQIILATVVVGGVSFALAGNAQANRYQISMGGGSSTLPSKSVDSLSEATGYGRMDLEAGIQLQYVPILGTTEIVLAWDSGSIAGSSFGRIKSDLALDTVMVTGRVRRDIRPRLTGFAEFGMGIQWGALELNDTGSNLARRLEDSDKAAASTVGAGVDFQITNPGSPFELGLRAKLNYRGIASHDFKATPMSEGSDELLLQTSAASLGSVNTSGLAFGVGVVGRF